MPSLHRDIKRRVDIVEAEAVAGRMTIGAAEWRWLDTGGDGPPIVLLPGWVGDAAMYFRILERKSSLPRLIAVTYPGIADGIALSSQFAELLERWKVDKPLVVGSSFSSYWLQHLTTRHHARVSGYILGNGFSDAADLVGVSLGVPDSAADASAEAVHSAWIDRLSKLQQTELVALQALMLRERQSARDLNDRLSGVRLAVEAAKRDASNKVFLLECPDDPLISLEAQSRMRRRYPEAQAIVISGGGHYPYVLRPDTYSQVLREVWTSVHQR